MKRIELIGNCSTIYKSRLGRQILVITFDASTESDLLVILPIALCIEGAMPNTTINPIMNVFVKSAVPICQQRRNKKQLWALWREFVRTLDETKWSSSRKQAIWAIPTVKTCKSNAAWYVGKDVFAREISILEYVICVEYSTFPNFLQNQFWDQLGNPAKILTLWTGRLHHS